VTTPPPRRLFGAALVLGAATLWGSFGLFARVLYDAGYSPAELTSVRIWVGFLALVLVAPWRPGGMPVLRLPLRDHLFFAFFGIVGFAAFVLLFFATVERTTVAVAAALLYTAPAFVVVLARIVFGEAIDTRRVLVLGAVLAGVLLVTGALSALRTGGVAVSGAAVALGLGSGFTYALYTICSKLATRRFDTFTILLHIFAAAAIAMLLLALPWTPLLRAPGSIPVALVLGLGPSLLAFVLFLRGVRELTAGTAAMLASLEPVIAALLAATLLGEPLGMERLIGVGLIAGAALLLVRGGDRAAASR
jgi:drug/metabolite transporter, DME family